MDTQIKSSGLPRILNISEAFSRFIFSLRGENILPVARTKKTHKEVYFTPGQFPENPAATVNLGWRKDA